MNYISKMFIVLIFILFACSASCVSANEMNNTDIIQIDESLSITEQDMLTTAEGSSELNSLISNDTSDDVMEFNNDYSYSSGDLQSSISKELTIDENEYILNGNNASNIIKINSENVVLNNINVIGDVSFSAGSGESVLGAADDSSNDVTYGVSDNETNYFTDLADLISSATDNLTLTQDYIYNSTVDGDYVMGIVIDKTLTVDGSGYTIDANNLARVFNVTADKVVIKNVNFINGYCYGGTGQAGCVLWNGDDGELTDCNFTDSYAKIAGGVLWNGDDGLIDGCNFTANSAMTTAGAIYWDGSNGRINNTYFGKNHVTTKGGALYSSYNDDLTVSNCIFESNYANLFAGAIAFDYVSANIINTTFTGNYLVWSLNGGAIQFTGNSSNLCNLTDCTFESNRAGTGSSIYSTIPLSISNSTFADSSNVKAIVTTSNLTLSDNTLSNNNTIFVNGGAVLSPTTVTLNSSSLDVVVGTNVTLSGKIYDDNNNTIILKSIDFIVDEDVVSATFATDGTFSSEYTLNEEKTYTVTVNTTDKLSDVTINAVTMAPQSSPEISIEILYATEPVALVKVSSDVSGTYNVTLDEDIKTINLDGSEFLMYKLDAGDYNVTVSFSGDETYSNTSKTLTFTVIKEKIDSSIIISDITDFIIGESFNVTINVPDASGNISVYYDGINYSLVLENSSAVFTIEEIVAGEHSIVVIYNGDDNYLGSVNSTTFNAEAYSTEFANLTISNDLIISGVLVNSLGDIINNTLINYVVGSVVGNVTTGNDGSFTIAGSNNAVISISYPGTNIYEGTNITIIFDNLNSSSTTRVGSQFNITSGTPIETYAVDFGAGERGQNFKFMLTDTNGNPISNANVQFAYKTVMFNRTSDENGIVSLGVSTQVAGSYLCALSYLGDETHNATFVAFYFVLDKKPLTITASAKTYKVFATKKYTITLKTTKCASNDGKTYLKAGKKITMKINGVTYTAKTDSNGKATFTIKITKKGAYTAKISYAGDKTYNSVSKSVKITIK